MRHIFTPVLSATLSDLDVAQKHRRKQNTSTHSADPSECTESVPSTTYITLFLAEPGEAFSEGLRAGDSRFTDLMRRGCMTRGLER